MVNLKKTLVTLVAKVNRPHSDSRQAQPCERTKSPSRSKAPAEVSIDSDPIKVIVMGNSPIVVRSRC